MPRPLTPPVPCSSYRRAAEWAHWREGMAQIQMRVRPWDVVRHWVRELSAVMGTAARSLQCVANDACSRFMLVSLRPQLLTLTDPLVGAFTQFVATGRRARVSF